MQTDSDLPRAGLVLGDLNPQAQPDNQLPKYRGIKPGTVCVSAVGGGIHSGAWEVEVLTRLAEIPGCENLPNQIRVISGTSGGSYGAMFYTHAMYPPPGTRHPPSGETLRSVVQSTSLSSVVAAFAYHDLLGYCLPVLSGKDRGQAMEDQWVENGQALGDNELEHVTLWDWSQRLGRGEMPAVLFTSGTRESGRPIIFGTSRVKDWNFNVRQTHLPEDGAFPLLTTRVTTGARLSATFPWVSPAARPDPANQTRRAEHQLDGGYYDNYGIVALNAWLDEGLMEVFGPRSLNWGQRLQLMTEQQGEKKTRPPARTKGTILVIQIRYEQKPKEPTTEGPGFFFQLTAPIFGLYNARTAGQQLRTDDYFDVFSRYWKERGIEVENAAFDFKDEAPLSWHLTQQERDELRKQGESIASELIAYPTEMKKAQDIPDEKARHAALAEVNRKYSRGIAADRVRNFLRMKLE
jgi:hypothetical protein